MMGTWNKGALEIKMTIMIIVGIPRKKFGCFVNSSFRKRRRKEERHRLWNGKNVCQRLQIEKTIKTTDWYIRESNYRYVRCISKDTFDTIEAYLRKQNIGAKVVCKISHHVHPVHQFQWLVVVNLPDRGRFDNITDKRDKRRLMVLGSLRWIVRPLQENVLSLCFWGIVNIIRDSFLHCSSRTKHLLWKGRLQACHRKKTPKVRPKGRWGQRTHRISTPSLYCQQWFLRWSSS